MRHIYFLLLTSILLLTGGCSKDDDKYKVPELSIEDLCNQLHSSREDIIDDFPYAFVYHQMGYIGKRISIKAKIKEDEKKVEQVVDYSFDMNGKCNNVSIHEAIEGNYTLQRFYKILEIVNSFTDNIDKLQVRYGKEFPLKNMEVFQNLDELKEWLNSADAFLLNFDNYTGWEHPDDIGKFIHYSVSAFWNVPEEYGDLSGEYNIGIYYNKHSFTLEIEKPKDIEL